MRRQHIIITVFVLLWTLLFHYQSLRLSYLSPLFKKELPRIPLLFPPAGWIMFFHIGHSYGFAEVYGLKNDQRIPLDPHEIFRTRTIGYDNIRRNILIGVLSEQSAFLFCRYLGWKFPEYDSFMVVYGRYSDLIKQADIVQRQVAYRCP